MKDSPMCKHASSLLLRTTKSTDKFVPSLWYSILDSLRSASEHEFTYYGQ